MTTFRQVALEASKAANLTNKQRQSIQDANDNASDRPLLWKAAQNLVAHRYERETGIKIGANFDWSTILTWLIAAMPTIIKLLLLLLGA